MKDMKFNYRKVIGTRVKGSFIFFYFCRINYKPYNENIKVLRGEIKMIEAMNVLGLSVIGTLIIGIVVMIGFSKLLEYGIEDKEA
jgi:hypothetical protein